eukprot:358404-Chlamydomonas_euryale.AAC.8
MEGGPGAVALTRTAPRDASRGPKQGRGPRRAAPSAGARVRRATRAGRGGRDAGLPCPAQRLNAHTCPRTAEVGD